LRIRNAAKELNSSEMELLATNIGDSTIVLNNDMTALLSDIESLGKVMALTRNDECVHERKGVYSNPDFSNPHAGLFVNPDIKLQIKLLEYCLPDFVQQCKESCTLPKLFLVLKLW